MPSTLILNIKCLVNTRTESHVLHGKELANLPCINNAYLFIEDGLIVAYGSMNESPLEKFKSSEIINAEEATVMPTWCDSHTHLVFATSRENEFVDKIKGKSYAEIAESGGGILNSAKAIANATEDDLYNSAYKRLEEVIQLGTGAIEIKSGYGLSFEGELKMLRVIKKLKANSPIPIKATFLGAHTYPIAYKENHKGYIDEIIQQMLPVIAKEQLADYIDVFCETGFFSKEETETICKAGIEY